MGKILVAGKCLSLGVRGPGEKPSRGETRSSGTGGSQPGQESRSVSVGEAHIPQSLGTKGNQEGWPSWVEYRSGGSGGPHPGVDIFPDLSPRAKPHCGVKCNQGLHFLDCEQSLRMVTRARKARARKWSEASESRGEACSPTNNNVTNYFFLG